MLSAVSQVIMTASGRAVSCVSTKLYSGVQRFVALTLLTNQRFNYSPTTIMDLKTRRLTILSDPSQEQTAELAKIPRVFKVAVKNDNGDTLEGILLVPQDRLELVGGKPKVKDRLLVAFSGIGGCYEYWYQDGLKDLYDNYNSAVLMVNYRGVGKSTGHVVTPSDLIDDGYSIAKYALDEVALDRKKVHFYGASMGGGVATHVVAKLESEGLAPASVCIDRSYSGLMQTVHDMIPFDFLKSACHRLMNYTSWQIDSASAASKIGSSKLVVIRAEADAIVPAKVSLATALEDQVEGKAPFKVIDLPMHEKTDWEKMQEPGYPYWVKTHMESSWLGWVQLNYIHGMHYVQKFLIGVKAHCMPFNKELFPVQVQAYEKVLKEAENAFKSS